MSVLCLTYHSACLILLIFLKSFVLAMSEWFHFHMIFTISQKTHIEVKLIIQYTYDLNELSLFCRLWFFSQHEILREALSKQTDDFLDHTLVFLCKKKFESHLSTYQKVETIINLLQLKQNSAWYRVQISLNLSSLVDADAIIVEIDYHVRLILCSILFWKLMRYALEHDTQLRTLSNSMTVLKREFRFYFRRSSKLMNKYQIVKKVSRLSSAKQWQDVKSSSRIWNNETHWHITLFQAA